MIWLNQLLPDMDTSSGGCRQYFHMLNDSGEESSELRIFILLPKKMGWMEIQIAENQPCDDVPSFVKEDHLTAPLFGGGNVERTFCATIKQILHKKNDDAEFEPVSFSVMSYSAPVVVVLLKDCNGFLYTADKDGNFTHQLAVA